MEFPIFPLNGAVLYPGTNLPLNIFERRYIEMVDYALSQKRIIGMIQTDDNNKLFKIGCVGKINSFSETNDGRYLISLQGINCFKMIKELNVDLNFRIIQADIIEEDKNINFDENQKNLIFNKYKKYIELKNIKLDIGEIAKIEFEQLIKFIAMISPFRDIEKQALLETKSIKEFYNKLNSIIDLETITNDENHSIN